MDEIEQLARRVNAAGVTLEDITFGIRFLSAIAGELERGDQSVKNDIGTR